MRIHKVTMEGFGAYPEEEIVDFDEFADDGIFVITGKTGAGKTTILDAITFALFGTVPRYGGSIATDERVRSDYIAHMDKPTKAVVEFSQGEHRYRVSRTPTYLPPGKKTEKQTWAEVEEINSDGTVTVLATRKIRDVNAKIDEIIHLNAAQFTQVVLLAQGEFQRFLIADSSERRELLRKLFNTGRFLEYSKDLEGRAAELRRQLEATRTSLKTNIETLASEAEVLCPEGLEDSGSASVFGWATSLLEAKQRAATEADAAASSAKANREVAAAALNEAEKIAERQKRRAIAIADQKQLDAEKNSVGNDRESLDAARRADVVWPAAEARSRAQKALDAARAEHQIGLSTLRESAPDQATEPEALKALSSSITGEIAKLNEVVEREQGLAVFTKRAADANVKAADARDAVTWLEKIERDSKQGLASADKRAEKLSGIARGLAEAEKVLGQVTPRLEAAEEAERLTEEITSTVESTDAAVANAREAVEDLEAQVKREKLELKTAEKRVEALTEVAKALPEAEKDVMAVEARLAAAEETERLGQELEKALAERTTRNALVEKLINARAALLNRQRAEYAGELAAHLQDGASCAVCGSTTHPAPAVRPDDHVTEGDVATAELAVESAEREYREASDVVTQIQTRIKSAQLTANGESVDALSKSVAKAKELRDIAADARNELERLQGSRKQLNRSIEKLSGELADAKESLSSVTSGAKATIADLQGQLRVAQNKAAGESSEELAKVVAGATQARQKAAEAQLELDGLFESRKDLAEAIEKARADLVAAREAASAADAAAKAAATDLGKETKDIHKARGDHETVAQRVDAMSSLLELTGRVIAAASSAEQKATSAEEAKDALKVALGEEGFETWEDCKNALLSKVEQKQLATRIDKHVADVATLKKILSDPDLAEVPAGSVDLATPRTAYGAAVESYDTALDRRGQVLKSHLTVKRLVEEIRNHLASSGKTQEEYDLVDGLAKVVRGQEPNEKKMTLETFALAADLEEIVAHANVRLGGMTSGRFKLEYSDEVARGRGQSGLALDVVDAFNDETRPPESLSGGEKFQASLALALGLADVVTNRNGGARLDTLFIDEGFGALDPDTLNDVMDAIDDLRGGGRMVGLISHVEQVKDRIPNHIDVEVTEQGWSRLR